MLHTCNCRELLSTASSGGRVERVGGEWTEWQSYGYNRQACKNISRQSTGKTKVIFTCGPPSSALQSSSFVLFYWCWKVTSVAVSPDPREQPWERILCILSRTFDTAPLVITLVKLWQQHIHVDQAWVRSWRGDVVGATFALAVDLVRRIEHNFLAQDKSTRRSPVLRSWWSGLVMWQSWSNSQP